MFFVKNWRCQLVLFVISAIVIKFSSVEPIDDYITIKYMKTHGYHGETHHVITEDGYILALQRIVSGPNGNREQNSNKALPPVLLVHGFESSSVDFIRGKKNESLPYLLFERGYDIWLGNCRGAPGSINHTTLDPARDKKEFWSWCIHELGYYDVPAMIDHILKETGYEKLFYFGHSQGEIVFQIMASTRTNYNEKIILAMLASPGSYHGYGDNVLAKLASPTWPYLQRIFNNLRIYELPGDDVIRSVCSVKAMAFFCRFYLNNLLGYYNPESFTLENVPEIFLTFPTKATTKQLFHFMQNYGSGPLRQFDHGKEANIERYGSEIPPVYDLGKVKAPVAIYWGENDCWIKKKDIEALVESLPNVVTTYTHPNKYFNHVDILISAEANVTYQSLMETMENFQ